MTVSEEIQTLHTATVSVTGGRSGTATSANGHLRLTLARPAERGTGAGTDPEELFAAGYAACFDSSLAAVARRERVKLGKTTTTVSVSLHTVDQRRYFISAEVEVVAPECPQQELERLVAAADQVCPYSNAIRGNVKVAFRSKGAQ
ncbi:MAG: Ohr family peroxiredoxin [Micromonosporaceae bacterium]|jgi:osmotically inducible protein OsmC